MESITKSHIIKALENLRVKQGETLLIHSFLGAFGRFEHQESTVFEAVSEAVGATGTVIYPTYNYDFCHGTPYDSEKTPSVVGQLTEFARHQRGVKRSLHPVYSHAVFGQKQSFYTENLSYSGFGDGSLFSRLRQDKEASLLFFGVDFKAATFIHHVEETLKVPYRYLKKFPGVVKYEGRKFHYTAEIYSRYLEMDIVTHLNPLQKVMLEEGLCAKVELGRGLLYKTKVSDFFMTALDHYETNPFFFLEKPPK